MDWLIAAIRSIVDGFTGIFEFFGYFFAGLADMLLILGKLPAVLADSFHWLPLTMAGTMMTMFGIVILFKIFGRE